MIGRRFLIIHGVENRRPVGHWQYQLAETLRADGEVVLYPQLPDTDEPRLDRWLELLAAELAQLGTTERIVLCHSLGCLLWLHHAVAATPAQQVDRVLLVSPPSPTVLWPAVSGFAPPANLDPASLAATSKSRIRSASDAYARPHDLDIDVIAGGGHLSEADGYGRWPSIAAWCHDENERVTGLHSEVRT